MSGDPSGAQRYQMVSDQLQKLAFRYEQLKAETGVDALVKEAEDKIRVHWMEASREEVEKEINKRIVIVEGLEQQLAEEKRKWLFWRWSCLFFLSVNILLGVLWHLTSN